MEMSPAESLQLDELIALALRLHGSSAGHARFALQSLREHVAEVEALISHQDAHWKAETVDILIHCLLLLRDAGVEDAQLGLLFEQRLKRFHARITEALREKVHGQ